MTDPQASSARAYAKIRYRLLLVDLVVWFAFLLGPQALGISQGLAAWWGRVTLHEPFVILGYLAERCQAPTYWLDFFQAPHQQRGRRQRWNDVSSCLGAPWLTARRLWIVA
jgi:hypothetical protein